MHRHISIRTSAVIPNTTGWDGEDVALAKPGLPGYIAPNTQVTLDPGQE
jgi:hypothetical protein